MLNITGSQVNQGLLSVILWQLTNFTWQQLFCIVVIVLAQNAHDFLIVIFKQTGSIILTGSVNQYGPAVLGPVIWVFLTDSF